jgi:pimeloyl-ACP methyl ester carboxylesterase
MLHRRRSGGSKPTPGGYDAVNMAEDVDLLALTLKLQHVYVVGHDVGAQVAYALVSRHRQDLRGAMILDGPIPGVAGWDESMSNPALWHVGFIQVPGLAEKLVDGRQDAYLGYFFGFSKFTPAQQAHYVKAYGTRAQLHAMVNAQQRGPNDVPLFLATGAKSPFAAMRHLLRSR